MARSIDLPILIWSQNHRRDTILKFLLYSSTFNSLHIVITLLTFRCYMSLVVIIICFLASQTICCFSTQRLKFCLNCNFYIHRRQIVSVRKKCLHWLKGSWNSEFCWSATNMCESILFFPLSTIYGNENDVDCRKRNKNTCLDYKLTRPNKWSSCFCRLYSAKSYGEVVCDWR